MAELQGKATGDQKEHKHSLHFPKNHFDDTQDLWGKNLKNVHPIT